MKRLSSRDYATALMGAWHEVSAPDRPQAVRKFLELLRRQRATKLLPRILDWIERLDDQAAGRTRVVVTGAGKLEAEALTKTLTAKLGAVAVATRTDTRVMGGLAIRVGDTVVDGTVATRLQRLHNHLKN